MDIKKMNKSRTQGANKGKPYGKDPPIKSNAVINETAATKKFCLKFISCIIKNQLRENTVEKLERIFMI